MLFRSFKVKLKAEEAHPDEAEDKALVKKMVKPSALKKEGKRPGDEETFATNEEAKSPMGIAKELARKSFKKIRQETMMGKAGATSEERKDD